jgi:hypothetical protein
VSQVIQAKTVSSLSSGHSSLSYNREIANRSKKFRFNL